MATAFVMPKLQPVMEEGILLRWRKQIGQTVDKGEILVEIETEKAAIEVESTASGVLLEILVQEGQTVPVGEPLAWIGQPGETV